MSKEKRIGLLKSERWGMYGPDGSINKKAKKAAEAKKAAAKKAAAEKAAEAKKVEESKKLEEEQKIIDVKKAADVKKTAEAKKTEVKVDKNSEEKPKITTPKIDKDYGGCSI